MPIALHGFETWTFKSPEESKVLVFEMATLTKIIEAVKMNKIRNEIIRTKTGKIETLVQDAYKRQNQWLGRMLRMKQERMLKVLVQGKVEEVGRRGKPRTTWTSRVSKRANLSLAKESR